MPGYGGYSPIDHMNIVGLPQEPAYDRESLLAEFRAGYPDFSDDQALLGHLASEYANAVIGAHPPEDAEQQALLTQVLTGEVPYKPVWDPVQREAIRSLYASGGIDAVRELFPDDYVEDPEGIGGNVGDLGEHLLPPGARRVLEASRQMKYFQRLLDTERDLETSDVMIGTRGGGNYMRTHSANYLGGDGGNVVSIDGPMYYEAQEHPAMTGIAANPMNPTVGTMFQAMDLIPQALSYYPESKGVLDALSRSVGYAGYLMGDDALTEQPTSRSLGNYWQRRLDVEDARQRLGDAAPDRGEEYLQRLGLPDRYNGPVVGVAAEIVKNLADLSPAGTIPEIIEDVGSAVARPGAKLTAGLVGKVAAPKLALDSATDAAVSLPIEMANYTPSKYSDPAERAKETREGEQFMQGRMPMSEPSPWGSWAKRGNHFRDVLKEKNSVFQRMAATNPHIREDIAKQARERFAAEQAPNGGGW